ncbi:MAG: hypothetical protein IPJ46_00635 [Anaerolineales bacterium]|nr:hypothetical protein [Anaerolineales bacterium]
MQIDLAWTDNSSNETSFKVEQSPDGITSWVQIGTTATNVATYSHTTLDPATQYCYRVRASNNIGDSAYSNTSCATTPGEPNNGLYLGTSNAYVDLANPSALGLQTFTIETWFKRTAAGATSYTGEGGVVAVPLVSKGMAETETIATDVNYFLGIGNIVGNSTNVLVADFEECTVGQAGCPAGGTSGLNHPIIGVTPIAADGVWHHAAVTYDGKIWKLYLDGSLETTLDLGATRYPQFGSAQRAALGTSLNSTNLPGTSGTYGPGYFVGNLDETRIWNHARTQADIQGTINSPITSPQTGLVARWGLNETTGTSVSSSAGTSVLGTISGAGFNWGAGAPAVVNHTPVFNSGTPADLATGVSTPPILSVNVSDVDLDNLTVKFYGRPKASDFTIVAIPDPQMYAASYPLIYNAQMQWIVDNKTTSNIVYAMSLGDNVNTSTIPLEWTRATTAFDILTAGGVPYGIEAGNHDGAPAGTAEFNTQFASRKHHKPPMAGAMALATMIITIHCSKLAG